MCHMCWNVDRRLQQLTQLHSRLLDEGQVDGHSRTALLAEARTAVQADCADGSLTAGELLVLLDREADLLSRRAQQAVAYKARNLVSDASHLLRLLTRRGRGISSSLRARTCSALRRHAHALACSQATVKKAAQQFAFNRPAAQTST